MSKYKSEGKNALVGNWAPILLALITQFFIAIIMELVYGFFHLSQVEVSVAGIIFNILMIPLTFGLSIMFLNNFKDEGSEYNQFFTYYGSNFLNCIFTAILMGLFIIMWSLPFIVWAGIVAGYINEIILPNPESLTTSFVLIASFTGILCIIPVAIKSLSYSMTTRIYVDEDFDYKLTKCITASRKIMHGNKLKLFWLYLSFIGWFIVLICTFGIAMFYVIPYVESTVTAFYLDVKKNYLEKVVEEY